MTGIQSPGRCEGSQSSMSVMRVVEKASQRKEASELKLEGVLGRKIRKHRSLRDNDPPSTERKLL